MKTFIILSCVVVAAFAQKYSGKLESVDVKEIFDDESMRTTIFNCFSEKETCAPEFQEIIDFIKNPSTIEDNLSEAQIEKFKEGAKYMYEKYRPVYDELAGKHDPTGQWRKKYGLP
uniref:Chemosensory protein 20 n=1 Tax=Dendrolimus punctatus TaxID=238572 RepID=A0A2K8GL27_9NEOP|nr:Chemosensory protein 20 [Dendrolimus punctatus]